MKKSKILIAIASGVLFIQCSSEQVQKTENDATETVTEEKTELETPEIPVEEEAVVNDFNIYPYQIGERRIAICPLPGKVDFIHDVEMIKSEGYTKMVTLVSDAELKERGLTDYIEYMAENGVEIFHSPIIDYGLPRKTQIDSILKFIETSHENGEDVLIHCWGGNGRSGTVMGCYANAILKEEYPIKYVRSVREHAIETVDQEKFVLEYK